MEDLQAFAAAFVKRLGHRLAPLTNPGGSPLSNRVPTATDDAVINYANITVTHSSSTSDSVNSLSSQAALSLASGSLSLANATTNNTISNVLNLSGATLTDAGNVTVSGLFTWSGGTLQGPTGSTLTAQGGISIPSGSRPTLDGRTLYNAPNSTVTLVNNGVRFLNGAAFVTPIEMVKKFRADRKAPGPQLPQVQTNEHGAVNTIEPKGRVPKRRHCGVPAPVHPLRAVLAFPSPEDSLTLPATA